MREPSAKPRPNILMIVADQHRWDCVGAAGRYPVHTPNLDALASDGVWFDSAFTPIPLCTPARQSLLTGRRPEQAGGLWNYDIGPAIIDFQPGGQVWPQLLRSSGYLNGYVGKWHVDAQRTPRDFGYDTYVPLEDYDPWRAAQGLSPVDGDWFGGVDPAPLEQTRTHWCADRAIEFLNRAVADPGRPWHLRLDLVEPHLPCQPAAVFADRYDPASVPRWSAFEDRLIGKPYIQRQQRLNWAVEDWGWGDWAPVVARYYAIISQLDDAIGRLLAALAATGQAEDTLVVYTADHGDLCGSRGMMDKHYVMYDEVVRVPLVLRWPRVLPAGRRWPCLVHNTLDLAATMRAVAGLPAASDVHGETLVDPDRPSEAPAALAGREHVISTYNGQQFGLYTQRMIRTRTWKLVWNATDVDELYRLSDDPDELHNLIDDPEHSDVVADLRRRLAEELIAQGDRILDNPWLRDQLGRSRKLSS